MNRGASRSRGRSFNTQPTSRATKKARMQQETSEDESGEYSWYGKEIYLIWSTQLMTNVFCCS